MVDQRVQANTHRLVDAFRESGLTANELLGTTGYGYDDRGRDRLEEIFARVFGAEAALVRPQWATGTHALYTALRALTSPHMTVWMVSGNPYDTIWPVIRHLGSQGVRFEIVSVVNGVPNLNWDEVDSHDLIYVQRSRGYTERRSWGEREIGSIAHIAHSKGCLVMVDNCYGEFTQTSEPPHWGVDLAVGSLMKNPGGSISPTGGYVAGKASLVQRVAQELYAPGIGGEVGATQPYLRLMAQGLFLAPSLVGEALKGGIYASYAAKAQGIVADPVSDDWDRNDIVVALELGRADRIIRFCQAIQSFSPVDATAQCEPWDMPGYDHPIIMAAGGFVQGGSLELSADAPMTPPYRVYLQGGVNRWHLIMALDRALEQLPA